MKFFRRLTKRPVAFHSSAFHSGFSPQCSIGCHRIFSLGSLDFARFSRLSSESYSSGKAIRLLHSNKTHL